MNSPATEPLVLVTREGAIMRIVLNRPRAINALNSEMFALLHDALDEANGAAAAARAGEAIDAPRAILLEGAGERGFCGGGDIKEIVAANDPRKYFALEYALNYAVHTSAVPVVAIMDGITMGGGIGLGGHAAHRVVTERSRLAMPEARIGIIPDVGGHLLLAQTPGYAGEYFALTAGEMNDTDAVRLGFADSIVPSERLGALREALAAGEEPGQAIGRFEALPNETHPDASSLLNVDAWFDGIAEIALGDLGTGDLEPSDAVAAATHLVRLLEASEHAEAREMAATVRGMNPTSIVLTIAQLARTRAKKLSLAGVLEDDYRVVSRLARNPNFAEGVRAQLIDKDGAPRWIPERIEDVDAAVVGELLAPHGPGEAPLGLV